MSTDDEIIHRRVLNSVSMMIPDLALNATPPEIAQQVYRIVHEITGNNDPYVEAKKCANKSAMTLYPRMKDIVDDSNETLETACKLAIAGNAIDLGAHAEFGSISSIIEDGVGYQLDQEHYRKFKECVGQSSLILYLADNGGEIVFDRTLIEQLLNNLIFQTQNIVSISCIHPGFFSQFVALSNHPETLIPVRNPIPLRNFFTRSPGVKRVGRNGISLVNPVVNPNDPGVAFPDSFV